MVKKRKLYEKVLAGSKNIRFDEFTLLLEAFGFVFQRIRGSHHVYEHPRMEKPFVIQRKGNGQAKPYQVRQFLQYIEQYQLKMDDTSSENGA